MACAAAKIVEDVWNQGTGLTRRRSLMAVQKTTCPITRKHFKEQAKPLEVKIGDNTFIAQIKEFSTGSLGWYLNGKVPVNVGGTPVSVQIGLNLTIIGSKELTKDGNEAAS
jgi:hypothetical protein